MRKAVSPKVTAEMAAKIKQRLAEGAAQHDIAAEFHINQGRISEIKTGRCFAEGEGSSSLK